jgi:hypothetical protein
MSRYRFELAGPGDDADLRSVLAGTPMAGAVSVGFRREPSFFAGACVDGRFRQVIAARDMDSGHVVGFGCRSVMERYVNGRPEAVGYLSGLRLLEAHRNRGLVARGYAYFRKLHADGLARLYLTTIAEGNELALNLLTSGRAGLPAYHYAGRYHTAALPLSRRHRGRARYGMEVRPARAEGIPALVDHLRAVGPQRQFFPVYRAEDFGSEGGVFKGLRPEQVLLAFRGGRLVGTLAGWDQHDFRQTVVCGYGRALRWARPLYNAWARWRSLPTLPAPGEELPYLTAALPVAEDAETFAPLLDALLARAAGGTAGYLLLGLHEDDPLLEVVRSYRPRWYTTRLYLVCWEDGEGMRKGLDARPPYLELGCL